MTAYVPKGQALHVDSLTKKLPWNTDPPSNGQHYPAWAIWGFYTQPVNPRHGRPQRGARRRHPLVGHEGSQSTVEQLRRTSTTSRRRRVRHAVPEARRARSRSPPGPATPAKYGSNGYYGQGHIAICPGYDAATQKAFAAFRKAYRGHGPGGRPALVADTQGSGPSRSDQDSSRAPGWRNWSDAPGLKPGVPTWAWGFDSLPRHSPSRFDRFAW